MTINEQDYDAELRNWSNLGWAYIGEIWNDKKGRFFDGLIVTTSTPVKVENGILHTMNSRYLLEDAYVNKTHLEIGETVTEVLYQYGEFEDVFNDVEPEERDNFIKELQITIGKAVLKKMP